jgi:quercetin dioxygenase-like cupin family protein
MLRRKNRYSSIIKPNEPMNEIKDLSGELMDDFLHAQADVKRNKQMNAMDNPSTTGSFPCVDRKRDCGVLNVLGASIQFLVGPQPGEDAPCILKRTIPPGISVPMHSHDFVEVFFVLSGNFEVIIGDSKMRWIEVSAGDLIEVPSNVKHAFRNRSQHPVINLVFTTGLDHRLRMKLSIS